MLRRGARFLKFFKDRFGDVGLHEHLPRKPGTVVLDHGDHWSLIDGKVARRHPVGAQVERVAKAERSPDARAHLVIVVLERGRGFVGGIRKSADRGGRRDRTIVPIGIGARRVRLVPARILAGGQAPNKLAVALMVVGVVDRVAVLDL